MGCSCVTQRTDSQFSRDYASLIHIQRRRCDQEGIMFTRREFIKTTALAGTGLALFKGSEGTAWAFSQSPLLRKFISPLPGLGPNGVPVANAQKIAFLGASLYQLAAVQYQQQMHPDLPNATTLWGYMDRTTGK